MVEKNLDTAAAAAELDAELDKRDAEVRTKLLAAISDAQEEIQSARTIIVEKATEIARIQLAARAEQWYRLRAYLTEDEVESLCGISPSGLLDDEE